MTRLKLLIGIVKFGWTMYKWLRAEQKHNDA